MSFPLDETEAMLRDAVTELAARHFGDTAAHEPGVTHGKLFDALCEMGLFGILLPEAVGGAGLNWRALCVAVSRLGESSASAALLVGVHNAVAPAAASAGVSGVDLATGQLVPAVLTGGTLRDSTLSAATSAFCGNPGVVIWTDSKGVAAARVVSVTRADAGNIGLSDLAEPLQFEVEPEHVNDAAVAGAQLHARLRLSVAAALHGLATDAQRRAVRYAAERHQFGKPLNAFQAIQWKLADMNVATDAAWAVIDDVAQRADGDELDSAGCAQAFLLAARAARFCADEAVQIHGGYGFTTEYVVERLLRDAERASTLYGGMRSAAIDAFGADDDSSSADSVQSRLDAQRGVRALTDEMT